MNDEFPLLDPGPVPATRTAREAMAELVVSHRSAECEAAYRNVAEGPAFGFERPTLSPNREERFPSTPMYAHGR